MQPSKKVPFPDRLLIPTLSRLSAPNKLIFLGVHTKKVQISPTQYKRVLVGGVAIYWRREKSKSKEVIEHFNFTIAIDLFEWIASKVNKRETLYIYSYDVVTDFLALDGFRQMPIQDFKMASIYHKLTTSILKFSNGTRRIVVLDVQNYYPVKLPKLAQSFKVELNAEPEPEAKEIDILEWCKVKAGLVQNVVTELIKETTGAGRGSLKMTSSSTSHSIFRASYMKHRIITNHQPEIVAFERAAYVGGYTGVKKLIEAGTPDLYKLDVNSMYPDVMMRENYPTQMLEFASGVSLQHMERYLKGFLVIADVTLSAKKSNYPLKDRDINHYPLGEFRTVLTTASLKEALQNDEICEVHHVAVYMGNPIFKEFVTDVHERRMKARSEDNTALELMQKAFSNTLYGKFGQLATEIERVSDAPIDEFQVMQAYDPQHNLAWTEVHAGGSVLFVHKRNETRYTSFAIAAHVTDYARQKLFALIDKAQTVNVFYSDTDSLIVNGEGLRNLYPNLHQSEMGFLKLEERAEFFIGFAKKDYIFGDLRKLKGFSEDGKRTDGNIFTSFQRASFNSTMSKKLSGGAHWYEVNRRYNPYVEGVDIDREGVIRPPVLPYELDILKGRKHTITSIKHLANTMLNNKQRHEVGEWLA